MIAVVLIVTDADDVDGVTGHMSKDGSSISSITFASYLSSGAVSSILLLFGLLDQVLELKRHEV